MTEKYYRYKFDCVHADALFLRGRYKEAFHEYFRGATITKDARAAFNLAYMYYRGIYLLCDYKKARTFFTAASHMDGGDAEFNLALMCLRGEGDKPDFRAAVTHIKNAVVLGSVEAEMYLGNAYTLGYAFDPLDIECISMIPFHRLIRRKTADTYLTGAGADQRLEDARWDVIEADEEDAFKMFYSASTHADTEYIREMSALAKFMVGRSLTEGYGTEFNPEKGYRIILKAAKELGCHEAEIFLAAKREEAAAYGVYLDNPVGNLTSQ